jgi:hypothetical protein
MTRPESCLADDQTFTLTVIEVVWVNVTWFAWPQTKVRGKFRNFSGVDDYIFMNKHCHSNNFLQ